MQVTITHREAGGRTPHYYVTCTVQFSETERAVIKQRNLGKNEILVGSPEPIRVFTFAFFARILSPFLIVGGMALSIYDDVTAPPSHSHVVPAFLFFGGIALLIWSIIKVRMESKGGERQILTLNRLMSNPSFRVYAEDPSRAKGTDDYIREQLGIVKARIEDSLQVRAKSTFEL